MTAKIVVVGGGGHAKVVISLLKKLDCYEILGYTDVRDNGLILGIPHVGNDDFLIALRRRHDPCSAAIGVGNVSLSNQRERIKSYLESMGFNLPCVISPSAVINEEVALGQGTVVFDGVVVNSGAQVGECVILNTGSIIEHDCMIGDYVHVAPGATLSGGVTVGSHSLIGTGANVIQSVRICEGCLVGAGSTVIRDLTEPGVYAGCPARRLH